VKIKEVRNAVNLLLADFYLINSLGWKGLTYLQIMRKSPSRKWTKHVEWSCQKI